jgi:hypothetical protein
MQKLYEITVKKVGYFYDFTSGRQCTYNETLWRVRVTTLGIERQQCFHLYYWRTDGAVNNVTKVESVSTEAHKCVLLYYCATHVPVNSMKHTWVFMQNARYFCPILIQFGTSRQIFQKAPNIKYHEIRPVGAGLIHSEDRQTDRRQNRRFLRHKRAHPKFLIPINDFVTLFYRKHYKHWVFDRFSFCSQ